MDEKFHEVVLKRMEPAHYIKYLNMQVRPYDMPPNDSHFDSQYHRSEIFYEKINNSFWVFAHESEEKTDTCYVMPPKKSKTDYFSIDYYQSKHTFRYQFGDKIVPVTNVTIFSGSNSSYKIFVKRKSPIRRYRLIFSKQYLHRFLNLTSDNVRLTNSNVIIATGKGLSVRPIHEIEKIALDKLYFQLKYNKNNFNYNLSVTANAFNVTDQFFKLANIEIPPTRITDDQDLMIKILHHLEKNIKNKFPGIDALASDFYISQTKLKKNFKKTFNTTPLIYFRRLQINYAQEKMQIRKITVKELAFELGFKKSSTFSLWFKRYTGQHPNELQK
jgi:AraC-like DNA-binding protein